MSPREVERRFLKLGPRLLQKMTTEPMRLVPENPVKFKEVERYPCLDENDSRVRFNPFTCEVYFSSYRHRIRGEPERPQLEGEVVLMQRGKKPSEEVLLRWSRYPDIEQAIRGAGHILIRYGKEEGQMIKNTRDVISLARNLLSRFGEREVNRENIEQIAQATSEVLARLGFLDAEKPIKQKLAAQIISAAGKDRLQRVNPLISRTRLASAWLKATRELLAAKKVREKFSTILAELSNERDIERFYLSQARELMQEIVISIDIADLRAKVNTLKEFLANFFTPDKVKVAPYRRTALLIAYSLFGVRNKEERNLLIRMLGNEEESKEILSLKPIDGILVDSEDTKRTSLEVQERVAESLAFINFTLEQGRRNLDLSTSTPGVGS